MKLLVLIIAVILMSVFSESIYAQNQVVDSKQIDVDVEIDTELKDIKDELRKMITQERNGKKKMELMEKLRRINERYIPKKITIEKQKKMYREVNQAFEKYIQCINMKSEIDDCSDLKEELDNLNISTSHQPEINETTLNPDSLYGVKQCSSVTKEVFPDFKAYITLDITINPNGSVQKILVDSDESDMTHELSMFTKCVVHFAYKLNFENSSGKEIRMNKTFIFGRD